MNSKLKDIVDIYGRKYAKCAFIVPNGAGVTPIMTRKWGVHSFCEAPFCGHIYPGDGPACYHCKIVCRDSRDVYCSFVNRFKSLKKERIKNVSRTSTDN